jgi:hypothetical protein
MPTVNSQGTTPADGTEQTLWDVTTDKTFTGLVDLQLMQSGDTVVLKQYTKVRTTSTLALEWLDTYTGAQTSKTIIKFHPFPSNVELKVTLTQTAGVNRDYDWKLYEY